MLTRARKLRQLFCDPCGVIFKKRRVYLMVVFKNLTTFKKYCSLKCKLEARLAPEPTL